MNDTIKRLTAFFWLCLGLALLPLMLVALAMWLFGAAFARCYGGDNSRDVWQGCPVYGLRSIANDFKTAFGRGGI